MREGLQRRKRVLAVQLLILFLLTGRETAYAEGRNLVPVGQTVGITLNMEGVTVVDMADVEDYDGSRHTPAKDAGLRPGDIICGIDGQEIDSARELDETVNRRGDAPLEILFRRDGAEKTCQAQAALSAQDGRYRLGIWIRDAASGIGTVTYYDPATHAFGALGHGISENPEQEAMPIRGGSILKASIVSVQKGSRGQPGELIGVFAEDRERLGSIEANTRCGLRGVLDPAAPIALAREPLPAADREEVQEGPAQILCNIEADRIECFDVEIQKINRDTESPKGMVVKVTDPRLLERTGGIVQGMSGSPILQNGRLAGAVTHVFVNDPTRGYGIFINQMLDEKDGPRPVLSHRLQSYKNRRHNREKQLTRWKM